MAGNGGIIGPVNVTSRGKNTITSKTSSGDITLQPGTRTVDYLVVAGGGGGGGTICGGNQRAGGAGAGGGSGIVIIRGPSAVTFTSSPGPAATMTTHPGGEKVAKFTASATVTINIS